MCLYIMSFIFTFPLCYVCTECIADVVESLPSNLPMNLIHAVVAGGAQFVWTAIYMRI